MSGSGATIEDVPLTRVMALHALGYCERLFYLEEVEEIRVADERVYAGRTLHEDLVAAEGRFVELALESKALGLRGRVDVLVRRGGGWIPYEHKRGRSRRVDGEPTAWDSDRLQAGAYALLVEEYLDRAVQEVRIRYHADKALVRLQVDEALRADVEQAMTRAVELRASPSRPPVTEHEARCPRCSLVPVCLPEEARLARKGSAPTRLFPADDERRVIHIEGHGTRVGRSGHQLRIRPREGEETRAPIHTIRALVVHGYGQVSAQALQLCADHGIAVHWFGAGGWYTGTFFRQDLAVQRRLRQYEALREPGFRLSLARRLVAARAEGQLRYVLRATRGAPRSAVVESAIEGIRNALRHSRSCRDPRSCSVTRARPRQGTSRRCRRSSLGLMWSGCHKGGHGALRRIASTPCSTSATAC